MARDRNKTLENSVNSALDTFMKAASFALLASGEKGKALNRARGVKVVPDAANGYLKAARDIGFNAHHEDNPADPDVVQEQAARLEKGLDKLITRLEAVLPELRAAQTTATGYANMSADQWRKSNTKPTITKSEVDALDLI